MVLNVAGMLTRLEDQATSDRVFLDQCLDDYPEVAEHQDNIPDSSCPVLDRVSNDSGEEGVRVMTNFTRREFDVLWAVAELPLKARWNDGRMPNLSELRAQSHTFGNYPYALYATDVKFQPTERPAGRHGEAKPYFSAKHKLYGLKIEASVSPQGLLVDMSEAHRGAVADLTIMRSRMDQHVGALAKSDNELIILDHGEQVDTYRRMWTLLVDKGYYGASVDVREIHPKKNPPRGMLGLMTSCGIVVCRPIVSYATFTWSTKFYDEIQRLTFALTNFHVSLMPLREADRHWYRSVLARYESMVQATAAKRAESQQKSRLRRMQRIALSRGRNHSHVFTSP
ncbi:hypothetical protein AaE_014200 [Aphanomyces astaci]|uniref:Uncharacterized protein n=1 Tax=Aphanomyces astaci TaxID=112090 RepID=A0A6A4Z7K1_APHAT|nr:hypothetical protein AaE_014200 [Aphanomyces astaci]